METDFPDDFILRLKFLLSGLVKVENMTSSVFRGPLNSNLDEDALLYQGLCANQPTQQQG